MMLCGFALRFPKFIRIAVERICYAAGPYRDPRRIADRALRLCSAEDHTTPADTPQARHGRLSAAAPWLSRFLSEVSQQGVDPLPRPPIGTHPADTTDKRSAVPRAAVETAGAEDATSCALSAAAEKPSTARAF